METPRTILLGKLPCWYEIVWQPEVGIVLRIHEDFVTKTEPIKEDLPVVEHLKKEFGFLKFGREFGENFGFEHSLKFLEKVDDFFEYHVPTSLCRKLREEPCSSCKGSKLGWDGEKCLSCNGIGREVYYDYKEAMAVGVSLSLVLEFLGFPVIETSCPKPQLMEIHTHIVWRSMGGAPIGGTYGWEVVKFLRNRPEGPIPEMTGAMIATYQRMDGRVRTSEHFLFHAYTQGNDGWLNVGCPGDACSLNPSYRFMDKRDRAYEFSCHNPDTPIQQMTLLASLAALHDLVRNKK